jgi:hypothetical protein
MAFIEKADFDSAIRDNILDDITEADNTFFANPSLMDLAIPKAVIPFS